MAPPVLSTTRSVEIGTYIGQFFVPGAGNLPNDVRVPCLVGKGDRNILIKNLPIRRSFVEHEALSFSGTSPFVATTDYPSDGTQSQPVRLYTAGGVEVPANKWQWLQVSGLYQRVQVLDVAYDPLAIYYLDYQSNSRDVLDVIPEITIQQLTAQAQVREITAIGSTQDLDEYDEYTNYFVQFEIDAVAADVGNTNTGRGFSAITPDVGNTGVGSVVINSGAAYANSYDRLYTLEVLSATGVTPTRVMTIAWEATPMTPGNGSLPPTPLCAAGGQSRPTIVVDENVPGSTTHMLELGVTIDVTFGMVTGDMFYFQARGPGVIELDARLFNTNQFTEFSTLNATITPTVPSDPESVTIVSLPTAYAYTENNVGVRMEVYSVSGTAGGGNRKARIAWAIYGSKQTSGVFDEIDQTLPLTMTQEIGTSLISVAFDFGADHFVVGDRFEFNVSAPRLFYKGKEAVRNLTLTVGSVNNAQANRAVVDGSYLSDTPEGKFGVWSADTGVNSGMFELGDSLKFYIRNGFLSTAVAPPSGSRLMSGDKFTSQMRSLGVLDFSLRQEMTQIIGNPSQIATDITGAVTGVVGAKYVILDATPTEIVAFTRISDSTLVPYDQVAGTPFLRITAPTFSTADGDLQIIYRYPGNEPQPGQLYYVTAKFLRPAEFYNIPILFLTADDAKAFLAPSTTKNDLHIGASIAWDYAINGLFIIQVKDADDDGMFSRDDYRTSINAFLSDKRATDLVVLNNFQSLPDQLQVINRASDPFELHECMTWVGAPIGTPIGSEQQVGSLVFLARKTLAVYGQSSAHGTRVLVAPTRATRTITLEDNSTTTVTLDGSFVAAALAGLVCSFTVPTDTVLLKTLTSFDFMQTYRPEENLMLVAAQLVYMKDEGSGVYRNYEDVTVDSFSPDTKNINHMTQKQFVTKDIRRVLNNSVIGMVFPSAGLGATLITSILVGRLQSLVSSGLIGRYQNEAGQERGITGKDILVFKDSVDPTLFHIGYNYFLATTAKRIFGLYTVNLTKGFPQ